MTSIHCVGIQVGVPLLSIWLTGANLGGMIGAIAPTSAASVPSVLPSSSQAQVYSSQLAAEPNFIRPHTTCPDQLETLTPLLLRDLPSYANRVSARSRLSTRSVEFFGHVLVASTPEFNPLTLGPGQYRPTEASTDLDQMFFTTLERQYVANQPQLIQYHHWLFLAKTETGWWFGLTVSRIGGYPDNQPQSPPHDSSEGGIARAIRLWLRDCRAGAIAPLEPDTQN